MTTITDLKNFYDIGNNNFNYFLNENDILNNLVCSADELKIDKEEDLSQLFFSSLSFVQRHSKQLQIDFNVWSLLFKTIEPQQWYFLTHHPRIALSLPEEVKHTKKVIYFFENTKTGQCLIGKTATTVEERLSSYFHAFNSEESSQFLEDVRSDPQKIRFGIIPLAEEDDLDFIEKLMIFFKKDIHHLYNQRAGGGGGCARTEEIPTTYYIPDPSTLTPKKYYPIHLNKKRQIRVDLSPGYYKNLREIEKTKKIYQVYLYVIKQFSTGYRYYGITSLEKPEVRMRQHCYQSEYFDPENQKYNPSKKTGILHKAIAQHPDDFGFNLVPIFYQDPCENPSIDDSVKKTIVVAQGSKALEGTLIEARKSELNRNGPGGGPIGRNCKRRRLF